MPLKSSVLSWSAITSLIGATSLIPSSSGVQSGLNGVPANCSSQLPACSSCHSGSAPFAGRVGGPIATLTATKRALDAGENISVTTAVTGGVSGTAGGFICEATTGVFTPGATSTVLTNNASITHSSSSNRTWTYTYTAPNTVGPVQMTSCAMTANANFSTGGDQISFAAYDNNATVATPLRFFVLPAGVTNLGSACADGFGNLSVLGANSTPTIGNSGFAFQLQGASPSALAVVWAGINPAGFTSIDLGALYGLTGCSSYLANIIPSITATTSAGSAERAEGTASFPLPIPNSAALSGNTFQAQGGYVDPSVSSTRSMPLSFSNGLTISIP